MRGYEEMRGIGVPGGNRRKSGKDRDKIPSTTEFMRKRT
jgi:hypothetical protein